jgi:colanic acid biosynthesis glycosyl transferase WcaI
MSTLLVSMTRILILGINFYPELVGIGQYTGELAVHLYERNLEVRMVTAPPYYPSWQVQAGYNAWQYKREVWRGVEIYRCPLWVPRKPSGLKRLLHLLSFAFSSIPIQLGQLRWKPDLVLCIAPAFFCAPFALLTARLSGAKTWLHIQDFELDAAINLGMLPADHILTRWAARVESGLLKRFERVSTISERMLARLLQKGVNPDQAVLFPNWVDIQEIFPLPSSQNSLRQAMGIPVSDTVILYSGNMGTKQGLESIILAARQLQSHHDLHFILCGEGASRAELERAVQGLSNVHFLPLQPSEKLNQLLNSADIHILPQRADAADLVMPSKLLGMLASGKAVLATANPGTGLEKVVSQIGVVVAPGDQSALCRAILDLASSPQLRLDLGEKGRDYVCKNWSEQIVLSRFESQLQEVIQA